MTNGRASLLLTLRTYNWDQEDHWRIPLAKAIEGLTPEQADWRPPHGGYTIRELVHHINYYNEGIRRSLDKLPPMEQPEDNLATFNTPKDSVPEETWEEVVSRTARIAEGLTSSMARLTDEDLDQSFRKNSTLGEYLTAWISHDTYHTGQIVLLRRLQEAWTIQFS